MDQTVVLKKYANRRLYDTEKSVYVTLSDVSGYIRRGRLVSIVDAKTKEDVTAFILTQIVLEEAKKNNALLPVPFLHLIIRYGDNLLGEFFEKYLALVVENFVNHRKAMDNQFRQWLGMGLNMSEATKKNLVEMNPFRSVFDTFGQPDSKKDPDQSS
ncbi:polyhydroxyalkanoate synthesis repressor PhaR [Desulfosarcina ovata subsp. sediminis]|uniref:Polyhydroxyalkanoate synthesis repressor PhaR n=3 Tax=Desulfosarcina ovata TaxID=83564 RepID=A0A5K8ACF1_9BACT|nr:polyhydroxyalkanoate synthesis regulator DNA-binding domain-containing protein [Desulfosarcina ovata]BBO82416.1 polyhydroxyalkanoate synthesis repressor PhaR [Desulfosarcina ovata subsp. sediminis]BBO89620.1 polyhydroxyalkanoate synthesis repressor PhaR [Desulfosarcina ovata subsp. ovata]